jgi:hypothetical protein
MMAKLTKLESLTDRVEALEKLTVLRGYGKANTLQAKAIRFVMDNQRVLEEMIQRHKATGQSCYVTAEGDAS